MATKFWTDEKKDDLIEYLNHNASTYKSAARRFKTTEKAIISILDKMGMRNLPFIRGWISALEIVSYFGYDKGAVYRLEKAEYPFIIYNNSRYTTVEDFWKFIKKNKDFFDLSRLERGILIPEPVWLDEYIATNNTSSRKDWTDYEVVQLKHLYYVEGKTGVEIARILERTPRSIRAKIARMAKSKMKESQEVLS